MKNSFKNFSVLRDVGRVLDAHGGDRESSAQSEGSAMRAQVPVLSDDACYSSEW